MPMTLRTGRRCRRRWFFPGRRRRWRRLCAWPMSTGSRWCPGGRGPGRSGGSVPIAGGVVLVLTRLNRILEISRPDLVAVVEPGVILSRLKQAVEAEGLILSAGPGQRRFLHHRRQRRRVRRGGGGGAVRRHPGLCPGSGSGAAHRGAHHCRDPDHERGGGL